MRMNLTYLPAQRRPSTPLVVVVVEVEVEVEEQLSNSSSNQHPLRHLMHPFSGTSW